MKKPTVVAASEGTAFAQKGKKGGAKKAGGDKKVEFDKNSIRTKSVSIAVRRDTLRRRLL